MEYKIGYGFRVDDCGITTEEIMNFVLNHKHTLRHMGEWEREILKFAELGGEPDEFRHKFEEYPCNNSECLDITAIISNVISYETGLSAYYLPIYSDKEYIMVPLTGATASPLKGLALKQRLKNLFSRNWTEERILAVLKKYTHELGAFCDFPSVIIIDNVLGDYEKSRWYLR